jgi:hypothetical protein
VERGLCVRVLGFGNGGVTVGGGWKEGGVS